MDDIACSVCLFPPSFCIPSATLLRHVEMPCNRLLDLSFHIGTYWTLLDSVGCRRLSFARSLNPPRFFAAKVHSVACIRPSKDGLKVRLLKHKRKEAKERQNCNTTAIEEPDCPL